MLVGLAGEAPRVLSAGWISLTGLAWGPSGEEVWFTATGESGSRTLRAVSREGRAREVYRMPGNLTLHDVSRAGLILLAHDTMRIGASVSPQEGGERDVSWLEQTLLTDLSPDGRTLLFTEFGEGGGPRYSASLRPADGGPAVTLGSGFATALAADGKQVLSFGPSASVGLGLVPTGTGPTTPVAIDPVVAPSWAGFASRREVLPRRRRGREPGGPPLARRPRRTARRAPSPLRGWTPASPPACRRPTGERSRSRWTTETSSSAPSKAASRGASRRPLAPSSPSPGPTRAGSSSRSREPSPPRRWCVSIPRREPPSRSESSGRPTPPGVIGIPTVRVTPDGRTWAWSYARILSELYVAEGLK